MKPRCTTLRRYAIRRLARTVLLVCLNVVASWRLATAQGGVWEAFPANPTVGDTIWLVRALVVPAGWQVRAAKFEPAEDVEPLTEPSVRRVAGAWVVRYALAAWKPGAHKLGLPPIWRLGPDGRADSTAGGVASFGVASVIPDTLKDPTPQAPLAPLRLAHRNALPPLAAAGIAIVLLGAGVAMRRRPPRAAFGARLLAPVVVDACETARPARRHPHERCTAGCRRHRAPLGGSAAGDAPQRVPGCLDRRRGRPSGRGRQE